MEEFLQRFPLKDDAQKSVKVVIGEQPYKQSLNNIEFVVNASGSSIEIYSSIGHVAFLVSDWIKIQDSLEMTFNLIFGRENSLEALSLLKKLKIPPLEFADILWQKAQFVLVNRLVNGKDNKNIISKFIQDKAKSSSVDVLFVGNKAELNFPGLPCNCNSACAIHPSGLNLNSAARRIRYYDNWYTFKGKELVNKSEKFNIADFRIFK